MDFFEEIKMGYKTRNFSLIKRKSNLYILRYYKLRYKIVNNDFLGHAKCKQPFGTWNRFYRKFCSIST